MFELKLFFLLVFGHCLADTALQPDRMGRGKSRHNPIDMNRVPVGQKPIHLWWMQLTHHSMIHGGIVCIITGSLLFGIIEVMGHWIIDFFKCESKYSPYGDQALHLGMKLIYILLTIGGIK